MVFEHVKYFFLQEMARAFTEVLMVILAATIVSNFQISIHF